MDLGLIGGRAIEENPMRETRRRSSPNRIVINIRMFVKAMLLVIPMFTFTLR